MLRSLILSSLVLFSFNIFAHDDHVHDENCHHHENEIFDDEAARSYLPVSCQQDSDPSVQCIKDMDAVKMIHQLLTKMDDAEIRDGDREYIELTAEEYEDSIAKIHNTLEGSNPAFENIKNTEDKCVFALGQFAGISSGGFEVVKDFCHHRNNRIENSASWTSSLTTFNVVTGLSIAALTLIAVNTRAKSAFVGVAVSFGILGYGVVDTMSGCQCHGSSQGSVCGKKALTWGPIFISVGTGVYTMISNTLPCFKKRHEH